MTTPAVFIDIADAAVEQLKAADVAQGRVHSAIPPESFYSIGGIVVTVEAANPKAAGLMGNPVDWSTSLKIDASYVFGVNNTRPHEGITQLLADAYLALMSDESLGGRIDGLLPGPIAWDYRDPDKKSAVATMRLTVLHQTQYGALA